MHRDRHSLWSANTSSPIVYWFRVNQIRALQTVAWALVPQQTRGHPAQLAIDTRSQFVERFGIPARPGLQKFRGIGAG